MMSASLRFFPVLMLALSACAVASDTTGASDEDLQNPKANISLTHSNAALLQTSDTAWTLAKTGTVNASSSTVTWNITATRGSVTSSDLVVDGDLGVHNDGNGDATIGNIVVNIQTKVNGHWVTQSSDIADATHDDGATFAHVVQNASTENHTTFSENAASGHLKFMNRKLDTVFALVPQQKIPANSTVPLNFTATFHNSVLNLAVGTKAHIEVIVTFGNNAAGGPNLTDTNVDINGNGIIDPDEAKVRSVSTEIDKTVQADEIANSSVTLSDTLDDISTQGRVTFANPVFNLGATTGTVTVTYDGGTSGGSITNCAHAAGFGITDIVGQSVISLVDPVQLSVCNTQQIGAKVCLPGAPGCGWKDGDMQTFGQSEWVSESIGINLIQNNFDSVYANTGGVLEVGGIDGGFFMAFSSTESIFNYLPSSGVSGPLDADLADPTSTSSGTYGGDVVALALDVDFGDASLLPDSAGVNFGNLSLCNMSLAGLNNLTVRQFLTLNESLLGGVPGPYAIEDVRQILEALADAFLTGVATTFAQEHLVNGACP